MSQVQRVAVDIGNTETKVSFLNGSGQLVHHRYPTAVASGEYANEKMLERINGKDAVGNIENLPFKDNKGKSWTAGGFLGSARLVTGGNGRWREKQLPLIILHYALEQSGFGGMTVDVILNLPVFSFKDADFVKDYAKHMATAVDHMGRQPVNVRRVWIKSEGAGAAAKRYFSPNGSKTKAFEQLLDNNKKGLPVQSVAITIGSDTTEMCLAKGTAIIADSSASLKHGIMHAEQYLLAKIKDHVAETVSVRRAESVATNLSRGRGINKVLTQPDDDGRHFFMLEGEPVYAINGRSVTELVQESLDSALFDPVINEAERLYSTDEDNIGEVIIGGGVTDMFYERLSAEPLLRFGKQVLFKKGENAYAVSDGLCGLLEFYKNNRFAESYMLPQWKGE